MAIETTPSFGALASRVINNIYRPAASIRIYDIDFSVPLP